MTDKPVMAFERDTSKSYFSQVRPIVEVVGKENCHLGFWRWTLSFWDRELCQLRSHQDKQYGNTKVKELYTIHLYYVLVHEPGKGLEI